MVYVIHGVGFFAFIYQKSYAFASHTCTTTDGLKILNVINKIINTFPLFSSEDIFCHCFSERGRERGTSVRERSVGGLPPVRIQTGDHTPPHRDHTCSPGTRPGGTEPSRLPFGMVLQPWRPTGQGYNNTHFRYFKNI